MDKGTWYNKTICSQLNGQIFKDFSIKDSGTGMN